jgi:hypothetical protein
MVNRNDNGTYPLDEAIFAVLMDIREELQKLNRVMQCSNVASGFRALAKIASRDERAFKRRVANAVAKRVKRSGR